VTNGIKLGHSNPTMMRIAPERENLPALYSGDDWWFITDVHSKVLDIIPRSEYNVITVTNAERKMFWQDVAKHHPTADGLGCWGDFK
jgi:hypothetical protein